MPSLSSALEKLHIRRKSTSSSPNNSPYASPTRQNGPRRSFDAHGSPAGRQATAAVGGASRLSSDVPSTPPGRNSSMAVFSEAMEGQRGTETGQPSASQGLPRSQAQYTLPTIPPTPLEFKGGDEGMLAGAGQSTSSGPTSTAPPRLPAIERLSGLDVGTLGLGDASTATEETRSTTNWTMDGQAQPFEVHHDLALPANIFPATVPSFPFDQTSAKMISGFPEGFQAMQPVQRVEMDTSGTTSTHRAKVDLAFVADHYTNVGFPSRHGGRSSTANDEEHVAHLQKHLSLLSPRIFTATKLGRNSATSSASTTRATKVVPLKAGPVVPYQEAEAELNRQRESLIDSIVNDTQYGRGHASAALMKATGTSGSLLEVDPRKKVVFDRIGWTERSGILDTVDVHTTYLEPVIQEHVQPIEHNIYTTLIYREIHRYHIYPYIQPIADPNPTILPTRHLFLDESIPPTADGRKAYRVIYGDEAAEEVLGRKLTQEDRQQTSYERWIEGVDGIEYEKMEVESVEVGKKGWVERVGQRMDGEVVEWYARLEGDSGEEFETGRGSEVEGRDNVQSDIKQREMAGVLNDNGTADELPANVQAGKTGRATGDGVVVHGMAI